MDPRKRTVSPESALASDIFDKFCSANTLKSILAHYRQLCSVLRIKPTHFPDFYPRLRSKLSSWRAQGLWAKFEKRASHKCYGRGKACAGSRVLIIGSGPCGLRSAIEAQLLGAKVVLVEKRDRFSRNNVLHLWPFVITDLKGLGAKKFYGKFCAGSIDHISIRQLQCILLKVALLLGVEVHEGVSFEGLRQPEGNEGWRATTSPPDHPVSHYTFDVLIGADGRRNTLDGFRRKALRAKLAIAITANFINKHTEAEARVKEISGVSYIFNQKFFQDLNEDTGIDLENIVYYKDETHYFVMTAKKQSLLQKGVLLQDYADTAKLLSHENISTENLKIYALQAAIFSTENQLPNLEFAVNHYGQPDVAMFDFTAMYAAENACRVVQRKNQRLLMTLVGDSLLEPFWPTGSGCARGFLSSFDAGWMMRSWASGTRSPLEVMAERESIYRLLAQTTPENLNKEHTSYTIDPHSRYPNLNLRAVMPFQVKSLFDSDEAIPDVTDSVAEGQQMLEAEKIAKKRRRDSVIAVDALLSWMREQVSCYGLEMSDVRDAFVQGDVLCAIIHRFRPDLIEFPLPSEENVDPLHAAAFRNQIAFDLLAEEYGLVHVMSGWDSVQTSSADFLGCVAYLSQVYEIFRGEIPQIKYPRVESCEDLEEAEHRSSQHQFKYSFKPTISSKHHHHSSAKTPGRRSRMSSSGRESREGDSEVSTRRHKKRRSEDRGRGLSGGSATTAGTSSSGREIRTTFGGHSSRRGGRSDDDSEKNVPGLARDLEAKLKGRGDSSSSGSAQLDKQKPKDLIRAIGKIEKTDWNVQLIEKKIAENKGPAQVKAERDDKVPKWSREAFDDKREALKRKMEGLPVGQAEMDSNDKLQLFEETMKKLGSKLKEGNALEIGQRGSNKVSAMAEQLVHKLEKPKSSATAAAQPQPQQTTSVPRPVFEFPKKGGSECCHFCKERVYVVERMTAEGKFFHRNCFRCEYCNTALRVGNYVFDREGRYGDRFFCTAHYNTIWLYGWKKYDQEIGVDQHGKPGTVSRPTSHHHPTTTSQQILSEMDERGTTPERVEFENSVECASEDDLLSEMDEDEWTDRNFGASNADNNTPDEASDLSDDDITPEGGIKGEDVNHDSLPEEHTEPEVATNVVEKKVVVDSSDSDTEVASGDDESDGSLDEDGLEDDEDEDDEDDEGEEEEDEDEGGGSTTEIETDSEFAEDPPHSVPGTIPTIVVDEPEQIVTRMIESTPISHTLTPTLKRERGGHHNYNHHHHHQNNHHQSTIPPIYHLEDLNSRMVEPVKKTSVPERPLPRVTAVPKKWEPLSINPESLASKMSFDLKKKYLQGGGLQGLGTGVGGGKNKPGQPPQEKAAQNQFRSVLDMISEQQKLLQPAPKHSATMQAILDGAEKLKNKQSISPIGSSPRGVEGDGGQILGNNIPAPPPVEETSTQWNNARENKIPQNGIQPDQSHNDTLCMNRLNLEKTAEAAAADLEQKRNGTDGGEVEKQDVGKEKEELGNILEADQEQLRQMVSLTRSLLVVNGGSCSGASESPPVLSDGLSQSETETQSTIIVTNKGTIVPADPDKTPIAEKPFEHGLDHPSKDEAGEVESDTETGSGGDDEEISDLDDLDIGEEDEPVKIEPPRVEIEDEFGGVTLAVDVDAEIDESIRIHSSDSRDSLNSGVFLETELSDWDKEIGDGACHKEKSVKKSKSGKSTKNSNKPNKEHTVDPVESNNHVKSRLQLELDDMDFMDVDGLSSPEDPQYHRKKEGYAKLKPEEEEGDSLPPGFSVVLRTTIPHDDQPSPNTLERQQRPTYSSDDQDESGRSSTPTVESSSAAPKKPLKATVVATELVEAVNPVLVQARDPKTGEIPLLDKVCPFSNARDSLDYRKMKGTPTSPVKSKDLYSTYCVPSNKSGDTIEELSESPGESLEMQNQASSLSLSSPSSSLSSKGVKASPEMARKIEEINKERAKQNDLIRSMVMGRIRKSPDKNSRRGSRGSLSPLGGASSSGSSGNSASGSSDNVLRCGEQNDSRRSSQNSILSHSHDEEISSNGDLDIPRTRDNSSTEPILPPGLKKSTSSSSADNSSIPHQKLIKTSSTSTPSQVSSPGHQHPSQNQTYEPLYTSSPKFRQRPKFETPLTVYQSVTNPPTPVNPAVHGHHQLSNTVMLTPSSEGSSTASSKEKYRGEETRNFDQQNQITHNPKSIKVLKSQSPCFYRSMPDLSAFLVPSSSPGHRQQHPGGVIVSTDPTSGGFVTPDMKQWESYKQGRHGGPPNSFDREKARQAARERARLKSDEELGLSPTDYGNLKEKVRRKASVPENDDVFATGVAYVGRSGVSSVPTTPIRESVRLGSGFLTTASRKHQARPTSDMFDAAFARPNVDFPIGKTNPFLVSPGSHPNHYNHHQHHPQNHQNQHNNVQIDNDEEWFNAAYPPHTDPDLAQHRQNHHNLQFLQNPTSNPMSATSPQHQNHPQECSDQTFGQMKLRMSSTTGGNGSTRSERKTSPEKARSMGWSSNDVTLESMMPNYFSAAPTTPPINSSYVTMSTSSRTPLSLTPRADDGNWFFDKPPQNSSGTRGGSGEQAETSSTLSYSTRPRSNTLSDLNLSPASLHSGNSVNPAQSNEMSAPQKQLPHNNTSPSSHEQYYSKAAPSTKAKALSTDTLLDNNDDSDLPGGRENATSPQVKVSAMSVPDIAQSVAHDHRFSTPTATDLGNPHNNQINRISPERKSRKSKDRDRRRSLIQAVSDFFTIRGSSGQQQQGQGSSNVSPSDKSSSQSVPSSSFDTGEASSSQKEKFSLFKLTPKILQSAKDRRNSKSRENILSPPPPAPSSPPRAATTSVVDHNKPPPKPARAAFNTYLSQPELVIQRLTSSPTTYKSNRTNHTGRLSGYEGYDEASGLAGTVDHMATLSIVASPAKPARSMRSSGSEYHHRDNENRSRMREMQEIQLQLESVEAQQRSLETRGVIIEKRIRGEEADEQNRDESELMEEWFTLVREKTRLARFEKELLVRAEELELEARKERLEEQLDSSLLINDEIKSPEDKNREIELLHQLRAVDEQRGKLLSSFQDDMRQYENEDADLEAKMASSRISPKESNV